MGPLGRFLRAPAAAQLSARVNVRGTGGAPGPGVHGQHGFTDDRGIAYAAQGTTIARGAHELRVKESDRIAATASP